MVSRWGGCQPSPRASQCVQFVVLSATKWRRYPRESYHHWGRSGKELHEAAADGTVVFRKKLSRLQFCRFMEDQPACVAAMEACASFHNWAREMVQLGHQPKLIAPRYVKAFIKRQKNDAADAEAIVEAAQRPTMRFVEMKTEEQQPRSIMLRTRE